MFTGLIEEVGSIKQISQNGANTDIVIRASKVLKGTKIGDSIAVNGVCLTVTELYNDSFKAFAMAETMRRTAFSELKAGSQVNLERAMACDGRFGGHMVSGHIDGTGEIASVEKEGMATWVTINADKKLLKYIVEKGSVALDGISLTVAKCDEKSFAVSIIPHTGSETTLLTKKKGQKINIENDVISKYVEKMLFNRSDYEGSDSKDDKKSESSLTMEKLISLGF